MKLYMWTIILLLTIILFIRAWPKQQPIFSGPYQALKCGLKPKTAAQDTLIFNAKNGYLYYFDLAENEFKPLSQRVNKGIYFHSMEEIASRLEVNRLFGNKLVIIYIDYLSKEDYQKSIIKKTINLRSLKLYTVYKKNAENISSRIDKCIWVDPKKVNTSL